MKKTLKTIRTSEHAQHAGHSCNHTCGCAGNCGTNCACKRRQAELLQRPGLLERAATLIETDHI